MTEFPALYGADKLPTGQESVVAIVASGDLTATLADLKAFTQAHHLPDVDVDVVRVGFGKYLDDMDNDLVWTTAAEAVAAMAGGLKKLVFFNTPDLSPLNLSLVARHINQGDNGYWYDDPLNPQDPMSNVDAVLLPFGMSEDDAASVGMYTTLWISDSVAPAGDAGAYAQGDGVIMDAQHHWLVDPKSYSVSFPAINATVSVGGTSLYTHGGSYAYETGWNGGLKPVNPSDPDSPLQLHASGGGIAKYAAAFLQTPISSSHRRIVPDIALDGDPASGALIYRQGDSTPSVQVGGTVLAASLYAGLQARWGVYGHSRYGVFSNFESPLELLYTPWAFNQVAGTHFTAGQFVNPINAGNNGYGGYGYRANVSFDAIGGWGSPKAATWYQALQTIYGR